MRSITVSAAVATAALLVLAPTALGATKYADIRVVTNDGTTLADHRQYTDDVRVKASKRANCFGDSNPSSGKTYKFTDPNPLGTLVDAAKSDRDLRPLLITDAFVDDGFGFGVCDIGGVETVGFSYWYLAVNGAGATTGPDLIPMDRGDSHLWYLTTGNEAGFPAELVLRAPARAVIGESFTVKVTRVAGDGEREPAIGVQVTGALAPTDANGETEVVIGSKRAKLRATGGPDDVPSAELAVCGAVELADCPKRRGIKIHGTDDDDKIKGTRGPDRIRCGKGRDVVKIRKGERGDRIASNCERVVRR